MNSIDSKNADERIRQLFFEKMLPLSDKMKSHDASFFPLGFEDDKSSYYESRENRTMCRADFELSASLSGVGLAARLRKIWASPADAGLSDMADDMAELSRLLMVTETEDEDVSPFMYVMF